MSIIIVNIVYSFLTCATFFWLKVEISFIVHIENNFFLGKKIDIFFDAVEFNIVIKKSQ